MGIPKIKINRDCLRIGIDISQIVYGTGVSNYTENLVAALLKMDRENEYVLFGGSLRRLKNLKDFHAGLNGDSTLKTFPFSPMIADFVWNRLHMLPVEWLIGKVDVFHSSDWTQPPTKAFKVTTVHDLVPLRFPKISYPKIVSAHKKRLEWVKKEADKIIAVSEFTKREIIELLGIEPGRIRVIYEAPSPNIGVATPKKVDQVKRKYKIDTHYLLVVGADARKNIPAILQAFDKVRKDSMLTLVIAGRPLDDIAEKEGIKFLGHIPREDIIALYSGARAFVYTSLYEGFGLPILEAMKAGCPVVTSNISSMPEVAGDAAVLVDPTNPTAIADGIRQVLAERASWIKKGQKRVESFSWAKAAKETLEVYREAIQ